MIPHTKYSAFSHIKKEDERFPRLLREIPNPPPGLYLRGELNLNAPTVAVVGTRRATREGLGLARQFGKELAEQEIIVVSGLALGIDQAAHWGALDAGGRTVAVLGTGIDEIYPSQNRRLAEEILKQGGAVISEYPPGTPSYPANFLQRNRIISGLSLGVLVVEAPLQSGSLFTAQLALEQNRDVFVAPGRLRDHNYTGSHRLIRSGAALVTSVEDICQELNLPFYKPAELRLKRIKLDPQQDLVLKFIKAAGKPVSIDKIIEATKIESQFVNQVVAFLLINDIIKEEDGRYNV